MGFSFQLIHFSLYFFFSASPPISMRLCHTHNIYFRRLDFRLRPLCMLCERFYHTWTPNMCHRLSLFCNSSLLTVFSSKLLGFICELVESSQTVQQHMIQVNYLFILIKINRTHTFSKCNQIYLVKSDFILKHLFFSESWISCDIVHVAKIISRTFDTWCAQLIFELNEIFSDMSVG